MTDEPLAYSKPVSVLNLRPDGVAVRLQPDEIERAAIAKALDIPSIEQLDGTFHLTPKKGGLVHVGGLVRASLHQLCVVSLDPFPVPIEEEVAVDFAPEVEEPAKAQSDPKRASPPQPIDLGLDLDEVDPPDPIIDGKIDLGGLLVEFVALGLDPFPRKPGIVFDFKDEADIVEHPFAALSRLKGDEER